MEIRNSLIIGSFLLILSAAVWAQDESESYPPELDTETKRLSYMVGMDMGRSLKSLDADLDLDLVIEALRATMAGEELLLTEAQANAIKQEFIRKRQQELAEEARARAEKLAQENRAEGQAFLAANAEKEGVEATESGLQYKVIEEGGGPSPDANDRVTVHYTGTLIDGTVFDSSRERGEPATFALNQVIPGWTEGLQLMREGGHFKFFIPAELAYGERGAGNIIEPGATLIFDVELLKVEPVDEAQTTETESPASEQ